MSPEPEILKRGKRFHRRVQRDWKIEAEGNIHSEQTIPLLGTRGRRVRSGRIDLFVDDLDGMVVVVEIKSTDWDRIPPENRRRLLRRHRRQVWKYIDKFLDGEVDVVGGVIYPKPPAEPGLRQQVEEHLNDYGLQVVWYDELPAEA